MKNEDFDIRLSENYPLSAQSSRREAHAKRKECPTQDALSAKTSTGTKREESRLIQALVLSEQRRLSASTHAQVHFNNYKKRVKPRRKDMEFHNTLIHT